MRSRTSTRIKGKQEFYRHLLAVILRLSTEHALATVRFDRETEKGLSLFTELPTAGIHGDGEEAGRAADGSSVALLDAEIFRMRSSGRSSKENTRRYYRAHIIVDLKRDGTLVRRSWLLALCLAAGLTAPAASQDDPLIVNMPKAPATIDPSMGCGFVEVSFVQNFYIRLTQYGTKPGPDGTTAGRSSRISSPISPNPGRSATTGLSTRTICAMT